METLFRGIVMSSHPENLKSTLLQKGFESLKTQEITQAESNLLFKLFIEWILKTEKASLQKYGHLQLVQLAKDYPEYFQEFVTPNVIIEVFQPQENKAEVAVLIGEIIELLQQSHKNEEHLRTIANVAKVHLVHFLKDQGIHLDVAASIGKLYATHYSLLPNQTDWQKVTCTVVKLLANYRCKKSHPVTNVVSTNFVEKADQVSEILSKIWGQSLESRECIEESLRLFYVIISSSDSDSRPSCALMSFIDKVPSNMMEKALETIIDQKSTINNEEGQTVVGLQTMMEWLTQRPGSLLSGWIMHMLIGLQKSHRYSVLIEITHGSLEKLLNSLWIPALQDTVENLFFYLLLGFQHSETAFHRIVTILPDILAKLQKNPESPMIQHSKTLERLVEATYFMLALFPDFPDLYGPLLKKLQDFSFKPPDDKRKEDLSTLAWLHMVDKPKADLVDGSKMTTNKNGSDIATVATRSETGMVGLVNLGNTCYMNSVLQALYITRRFCDVVMSVATNHQQQPVLAKLQKTFAYLRLTLRALYSPSDFLKAARPPWFEPGRQQDCSEFLRYLLDTLQEQEKSVKSDVITNFREHKMIVSKSDSASVASEEESVKNSTSDNSVCLDAIVEEDQPEVSGDVEMLSQEGSEDFGSHMSLQTKEEEDEELEDLSGSRNSLSGLKRWTTEENLSSNGGSRSELMEIPLHDSHSNSTDSGIQSVGDSIRGSSDSMSNGSHSLAMASHSNHESSSNGTEATKKLSAIEEIPSGSGAEVMLNASEQERNDKSSNVSLVQKVFGGKLQTTYQCSNCKSISLHKEAFTDLHLAVPPKTKELTTDLNVQKLVDNYLKPEVLDGENQYHCDQCSNLQDANKTMKILEGPEYLMTTLMRFHYDRQQNRKSKIFTEIDYELELKLPIYVQEDQVKQELYSLYAIVVHSGYSSDGGHYYTYGREPIACSPTTVEVDLESHNKNSQWYIFNDSKVSFSSFESFKNVSKRFPRDTAYVLFYQKVLSDTDTLGNLSQLKTELKMCVEQDNIKFMREKEKLSQNGSKSMSNWMKRPHDRNNDDDQGGRGGCGGGGFNNPGRFVC